MQIPLHSDEAVLRYFLAQGLKSLGRAELIFLTSIAIYAYFVGCFLSTLKINFQTIGALGAPYITSRHKL